MKTKIIIAEEWEFAVPFIKKGIPIVMPTETVYGLAALISMDGAIERVFEVKGRPQDNPLIVHVASFEQACALIEEASPSFRKLAERFWPGPLTIVMEKKKGISDLVTGGLSTIAIRMPSHPVALALIEAVGPLAAPSANISGRPSPTKAEDVLEDLDEEVPLIVDGGECSIGIESTVVRLIDGIPIILRPGVISQSEIEECLNRKVGMKVGLHHSPGTSYRHYAPRARISLVEEGSEGTYLLSLRPRANGRILSEKTFYAELRRADRLGVEEIQIENSLELQLNHALLDRVMRSSGLL